MVLSKLKTYGELVMFSHTIFSLPFALISMFIAAGGLPESSVFIWIMVALFAGRNGANALNRWVDRDIDKKNPRTASRHLPSGKVKEYEVLGITFVCYALFVFAAYKLNFVCFVLSPVALILFSIYSYTKRFTWACHIVLGITVAGAPVGAWLAVDPSFNLIPFVIAAVVAFWVAGFDILYGTQDIEFDRKNKVYSIPMYFGLENALRIAKAFHGLMIFILLCLGMYLKFNKIYFIGIFISGVLLIIEHYNVNPKNEKIMKKVSYSINQVISIIIFIFTTASLFL